MPAIKYKPYEYDDIVQYLEDKEVDFTIQGREVLANCLFSGCDDDSRGNEHHLSFNRSTGQYRCFKCGAKGNLTTLKKHMGDNHGSR